MPICAETSSTMQDLIEISYETSEQHKEEAKSRVERDWKESKAMEEFLEQRNLLKVDGDVLQNIGNCK